MVAKLSEPTIITDADVDPGHNWKRALSAPGVMNVDFEERINFQRLHRYRLARTRQALRNSQLGALLTFDGNNIRYITSTNIGEWSRDKMCRFALLAGDASPHLWDFGSAAAPPQAPCTVARDFALSRRHARPARRRAARGRTHARRRP